jgi:purine-binding chemotaxis protein CheW
MRNVRQAAVPQVQLVTFKVGGEEFGLDVFAVHEILRYQGVTPVPRAPAFVEGVLDVRGSVVPVIDVRRRFEVREFAFDDDTRIVLVEYAGERLGLVVDIRGLAAEFVRGIVRLEGRLVILLDLERILSSEERIALEAAELVPAADDGAADGA